MKAQKNYNRITYGLGTFGRDMVYTLVSMYLMFYLTDILNLDTSVLWWVTAIMFAARVFDACNDPFMGMIVDNTHTKWGKFKPWILVGVILSTIFTLLLFTDLGLKNVAFIVVFGVVYVLWGISYTMNDISYWSMMPSLTQDQKEREKIGSVARICASIGMFLVVVLIVPVTTKLGEAVGSMQKGYLIFTIVAVVILLGFQSITLIGVKEPPESRYREKTHTSVKEMLGAIFHNDQLLIASIAMALFMIGYCTTTGFGLYYFKYVYGNEGMYSVFAGILGVSQIAALAIFPILSKKYSRKKLYLIATLMVVLGYIIFFFSPNTTMIFIGISGVLLFVGQAFIQLMMLMFLTDSVEYGEWKFGKRNDSVTLSLQPFINKLGGAVSSGVTGIVVIISGMKEAQGAADMTAEGLLILKVAMLILPLLCILIGFIIWKKKYFLDENMYAKIVEEINERKQEKTGSEQ